ncbi:MAG: SIMPL domain-containing protein [Nitrospirae bacterium]|nr:SIMPL domain-containing protein [Nitrospirota bacterium]
MKKSVVALIFILIFPVLTQGTENQNSIQLNGSAQMVVKPDIAHCFIRIKSEADNFDNSLKAANDKLSTLKEIIHNILDKPVEVETVSYVTKPKGTDYSYYENKQYFVDMAKAMKGEIPSENIEKEKFEAETIISVYFGISEFRDEQILVLKDKLSEKNIAFDKKSSFMSETLGQDSSIIYYGINDPDIYLGQLIASAHEKAKKQAEIIAKALNKKVGDIMKISGCGSVIEGTVDIYDKSLSTGKDLGPLSADSKKLVIKFDKDFEFELK